MYSIKSKSISTQNTSIITCSLWFFLEFSRTCRYCTLLSFLTEALVFVPRLMLVVFMLPFFYSTPIIGPLNFGFLLLASGLLRPLIACNLHRRLVVCLSSCLFGSFWCLGRVWNLCFLCFHHSNKTYRNSIQFNPPELVFFWWNTFP
jgi:hypothetical protein